MRMVCGISRILTQKMQLRVSSGATRAFVANNASPMLHDYSLVMVKSTGCDDDHSDDDDDHSDDHSDDDGADGVVVISDDEDDAPAPARQPAHVPVCPGMENIVIDADEILELEAEDLARQEAYLIDAMLDGALDDPAVLEGEEDEAVVEAVHGHVDMQARPPRGKGQVYHVWDRVDGVWVDSRRTVNWIMANLKQFLSKDRLERVAQVKTKDGTPAPAFSLSLGSAAAAPDQDGNQQTFGLGSYVAVAFEATIETSYRFWIGKIVKIWLIPPNGKKELISLRMGLDEITENMYLSVTWLDPRPGQEPSTAIKYVYGPAKDNINLDKAKYIINVLKVVKPSAEYPYFQVCAEDIKRLSDHVRTAKEADDEAEEEEQRPKKTKIDRIATQLTEDAGAPTMIEATSRGGRKRKVVDTSQLGK